MITGKIDLAKIKGAKVLKKDGRTFVEVTDCGLYEGQKGALYVDLTLWETPGGQYGDWRITQDVGKDARAKGEKGAILGNGKNRGGGTSSPAPAPRTQTTTTTTMNDEPPF